ncbi:MAG: phenylalanine--tRNA ligase subunit beta [bacterium]|nr:phenylalanine--tRNA ligase subunit beta [bacterium]
MKISLDWLRDFVTWDDEPAQLAARLTAAGLNVEGIETISRAFPGVVVARVLEREKHPDADRLSLCKVDDGTGEPVQVVCGAPNVRAGLTVLFARVGAQLPGDFQIKKSKIRGVESCGMICSATELGLGLDGSGIIELDTKEPNGTPADDLYGFQDTVLEVEVTPNRPDWLSHVGVAREVAAIYGTKMSLPPLWNAVDGGENLGVKVRVEDYSECGRYTAWGVQNVKIGPSPRWMQDRLRAIGARPINNVVDITNYVMFEMGQPLHAFDRGQLAGSAIIVRRAPEKMTVTTLDGQEREIEAGTLLICDEKGPVALAGVMGLGNSEVTAQTTEILLESAFFNPQRVRRASRRLGLISESSYRFERGADWDMVERAALRALHLLQEYAGARIIPDWADRHDPDHRAADALPLRVWQVNRVLGTSVTTDQVAQILQRLGLKVQPMGNAESISAGAVNMMVHVPSHRRDLALEVDLIEEIARIHGLDQLAGRGGYRVPGGAVRRPQDVARERLRGWLSDCGYAEIVTSSFMEVTDHDRLGLPADDARRKTLSVINPRHGGDTQLRTLLAPSALDVARRNLNAGATPPLRFFQVNRVFRPGLPLDREVRHADEALLPAEPEFVQLVVAGWRETGLGGVPADLLELRGSVEALAAHLRVPLSLEPGCDEVWLDAGASWRVLDGDGKVVGSAGRVAAAVLEAFDVDAPVAVAEVRLDCLDLRPAPARFEPFTRFPAVKRDLSLLVPAGVAFGQVQAVVTEAGGPLLESSELFDIYRGKGVPEGLAAFGIRLKFRSAKGSLKGEAVDAAIGRILGVLRDRLAIEPRG